MCGFEFIWVTTFMPFFTSLTRLELSLLYTPKQMYGSNLYEPCS